MTNNHLVELTGRACSALRDNRCVNGFYVTAVCHGIDAEHVVPTCCNERRCAHLYGDKGWPFARSRATQPEKDEK